MARSITELDDEADRLLGAIWGLVQDAGHLGCGGWTFDSRDPAGQVTCACGDVLEVRS